MSGHQRVLHFPECRDITPNSLWKKQTEDTNSVSHMTTATTTVRDTAANSESPTATTIATTSSSKKKKKEITNNVEGAGSNAIQVTITGTIHLSGGTALFAAGSTQMLIVNPPSNICAATSITKKIKGGTLVTKPVVQKSARPDDPSEYKDSTKVWTENELAWQNPIRGENGIGRVIFDPLTNGLYSV